MELFRSRTARIRPHLSIPVGLTPEGKPAGLWLYSGFLKEPDAARLGLRSGAGDQAAEATAISGIRSTRTAGCRYLCDVNGRSGAEISEWPRKDLASHWIWKTVYSVTGAAHCCGK